jgi:hypothetical protein
VVDGRREKGGMRVSSSSSFLESHSGSALISPPKGQAVIFHNFPTQVPGTSSSYYLLRLVNLKRLLAACPVLSIALPANIFVTSLLMKHRLNCSNVSAQSGFF